MKPLRLLLAAKTAVLRTFPLMRDVRVPIPLKVAAGLAALLIVSPVDLFGDIPVLGALDDAALLTLVCMLFVHLAGRHVEPVPVRRRDPVGSALVVR